ncbi:hypothetical protein FZEAL_5629 [Fusarium zealandicum]|uniref:Clr5 domain-containing protein n=1 Tax=Fusarium zealandicum TaxID=1053134 RepID=A0A8H4UJE1_9HYPO|nr:hypothetical protein FZEAL_5629 [Fusarium zealandicum]
MASQLLAPLAPHLKARTVAPSKRKPGLPVHHSDKEWAAVYPHIERMYVRERRKLKYVMVMMEEEYSFKATLQMYKKRFTKWGFCKNKRRVNTASTTRADQAPGSIKTAVAIPTRPTHVTLSQSPGMSTSEAANLVFLKSIQTWSSSFYESGDHSLPSCHGSPIFSPIVTGAAKRYDPEQLSFAFRVVAELLRRGQGELAGRLARKSFLQIEAMLHVEGPLFIWNILEIMYSIASLGQVQLFQMLLLHLVQLGRNHFSATHPVAQMLHSLQRLVEGWRQDSVQLHVPLLGQAWALNANIVFSNFDSRLLLLYYRLIWDSGMVKVPQERLREADEWFAALDNKVPMNDSFVEDMVAGDFLNLDLPGPPRDFEILKHTSVAAIQHRSTLSFTDPNIRIRVMSGILKSRILQEGPSAPSAPSGIETDSDVPHNPNVSRLQQARVIAYLMKILVEVDQEMGFDAEIATDRMRSIIAMRVYGRSGIGPQIVHELWQLEELLLRQGHRKEASEVREETYKKLEQYLSDVPAHSVSA